MSNNTQKIQLSNTGLADLFVLPVQRVINIKVAECPTTSSPLSFSLQKKTSVSDRENTFLSSTSSDQAVRDYIRRLLEIESRNTILDTDKVMFTKNSKFPRISFNRYSTKAKRVQVVSKATKFVIGDEYDTWAYNAPTGYVVTGDSIKKPFEIRLDFPNLITLSKQYAYNRYDKLIQENRWANHQELSGTIRDDLLKIIIRDTGDASVKLTEASFKIMRFNTIPEEETFKFLLTSPDISKIVTDTAVNAYLAGCYGGRAGKR